MTPTCRVLAVLLRSHLIDDNPEAHALATRLTQEVDIALLGGADPVQAVAEQLDRDGLGTAGSEVVQETARKVVETLRRQK